MKKHTKQPWRYSEELELVTSSPKGHTIGSEEICNIDTFGKTYDEVKANGKLLAAAPDLLNACIEALKFVTVEENAHDILVSAINKATK